MKVSVVVPVHNGQDTIGPCVESVLQQAKQLGDIELIVVDDGSADGTLSVLSQFDSVRIIPLPRNQGPAVARNRGAMEATGDIILFTDADCVPSADWITEMTAPFKVDPKVVGVKGVYKTRQREITARFVQLEFEYKYARLARQGTIDFIDGYSAGYRRSLFLEMGGFDTRFPVASTEDIELSFRMDARGFRLVFNPRAVVYHLHPTSWWDYIRRKYKYAYWGSIVVRRFPNKAFRNSYTPTAQKLQLLLVPFCVLTLSFSFLSPGLFWASVSGWLGVLLTMTPFLNRSIRRDPFATLASPLYLIPRALVQSLAVGRGLWRLGDDLR